MVTTKCEQCGATISRRGDKPGRFCSLKCKGDWQRTQKPVDEAWLRQKYLDEGLSTYDIAKVVGRDSTRVHEWLVDYGIPTRPRGQNLATSDDNYMRRPGAVNPFQGKTHTEETRRVLSEKAQVEKPYLRGAGNGMYGKRGPLNPNYIDGGSPERQRTYSHAEWKAVLRAIYARDKYTCARCGSKRHLHAHHLKSWAKHPELRSAPDNLITLCRDCHHWVHSNANAASEYLE